MNRPTLLDMTSEEKAKFDAERRKAQEDFDRAQMLAMEIWLDAYAKGERGFLPMCEAMRHSLDVMGLPIGLRHRVLGALVDEALAIQPKKKTAGKKGLPRAVRTIAIQLVERVAKKEGLPRASTDGGDATARVAEIMGEIGIDVSEATVRTWWKTRKLQGDDTVVSPH